MKTLILGGLIIVGVHVAPTILATAAMMHANSGGGQSSDRISDVTDVERKRLLDARWAIKKASIWTMEDGEACSDTYDQSSQFAMCLQEEAYTRTIYLLRRGCLGSMVETCFEAAP